MIAVALSCAACAQPYTLGAVLKAPTGETRLSGTAGERYLADKRECAEAAKQAADGADSLRLDRQLQRSTWVACMTARGYTVAPGID